MKIHGTPILLNFSSEVLRIPGKNTVDRLIRAEPTVALCHEIRKGMLKIFFNYSIDSYLLNSKRSVWKIYSHVLDYCCSNFGKKQIEFQCDIVNYIKQIIKIIYRIRDLNACWFRTSWTLHVLTPWFTHSLFMSFRIELWWSRSNSVLIW